ncbi:MAG: response regulator [Fuerstia sp.]|nr:response regulator [Fuerstiella sp.]
MVTHILVVDDSPTDRLFIGHFLRQHPEYTIAFANDGVDAIEAVKRQRPALIVSDLRMPRMNGLEFVRKLNVLDWNIPVILMTSFGSEQIAVDALTAGAASYVAKRNLESELVNTIRNVMAITERKENRRRTLGCLAYAELHFVLGNDGSAVAHLISHLLDAAVTMKLLSGQEQTHVGIALQEALSNAIHHGNLELDSELRQEDERDYYALADQRRTQHPYASRKVYVDATLSRSELSFVVTDEGPGFDTTRVLDPTAEVNLDRIGGRGLLLISSFMDSVTYNARGNQITMVKHVSDVEPKVITPKDLLRCQSLLEAVACS